VGRIGQVRQQRGEGGVEVGPALPGQPHGGVELVAADRQVGTVHREPGDQLREGVTNGGRAVVGIGDLGQQAGQPAHLTLQDAVGDGPLAGVDQLGPGDVAGRGPRALGLKYSLQRVEPALTGGVDEHPVEVGEGVVAGGAVGGPIGGQLLAALQDLLDEQVAIAHGRSQPVEVPARIGEAVGVVDPQALHLAAVHPAQDLAVGLIEDPRHLDADTGEGVHGEEPAVVEGRIRLAPVDQFVVLTVVNLPGAGAVGCGALRDREPVVVVVQFVADDAELVQLGVAVAEDRQQQASVAGRPVHVERLGVAGGLPGAEQVPPPGVRVRRVHADVVGHDVDQDAPAGRVGARGEPGECLRPAAGGVNAAVIDDVVAVVRALLRSEQRGEVDPVGTEFVDVIEYGGRLVQVEGGGDLQAIGRSGDAHCGYEGPSVEA